MREAFIVACYFVFLALMLLALIAVFGLVQPLGGHPPIDANGNPVYLRQSPANAD